MRIIKGSCFIIWRRIWRFQVVGIVMLLLSQKRITTLGGQMMVGAADPWFSVKYSSSNGLYSSGFHTDRTLGITVTKSLMGTFNSLYMGAPLLKSGLGNTLIGNGLMAPGQKALE